MRIVYRLSMMAMIVSMTAAGALAQEAETVVDLEVKVDASKLKEILDRILIVEHMDEKVTIDRVPNSQTLRFSGDKEMTTEIVWLIQSYEDGNPLGDDSGILVPIERLYGIEPDLYETKVHFQSVDHRELKKVLEQIMAETHAPDFVIASADDEFIQFRGEESEIKEILDVLIRLENGEHVTIPGSEQQLAPIRALFERGQESFELTIRLKNGVTRQIEELAQMFGTNSRVQRVVRPSTAPPQDRSRELTIHVSESLGWLRVSGPKEKVEEFRMLVEEVDVKPANVELTFYLVMASPEGKDSDYPKAIDSAINQLGKTFQYESFDLLDIVQLRAREGSHVEHSSGFPLSKVNTDEVTYDNPQIGIEIGRVSIYDQGGNDVFGFDVDLVVSMTKAIITPAPEGQTVVRSRNAIQRTSVGARMNSSLDVAERQSVVLGKSNFDHSDDALFVIVQAKRTRDDTRPIN